MAEICAARRLLDDAGAKDVMIDVEDLRTRKVILVNRQWPLALTSEP